MLDREIYSTDPVQIVAHSYDATNEFHFPEAVVRPRNPEDLRQILEAANRTGVPLFPRGAGTGFSGGSLPVGGGAVIDFLGMNRIIDIDEKDFIARVEPGVITLALQEAVEAKKLFYPPDPASLKICTIGGNVSENAGGPRCLKYGVTKDFVLGISGFTGSGKRFSAGKGILKNRAGYDLKDLLIGSEGTLAVFHEFLLRLIPKPEAKILFLAFFKKLDPAAMMVGKILHQGIQPSCLEFMDGRAIEAVEKHSGSLKTPPSGRKRHPCGPPTSTSVWNGYGLPLNQEALLLIEVDGRADEMALFRRKIENCLKGAASEIRVAVESHLQEELWEIRRKASPAMRAFGNTKANEDIVVPRKHIPEAISRLRQIAGRYRLNIINFGHIGDGNIHVNIMYDGTKSAEKKRVNLALEEIFAMVNQLEGAISGEHGIGLKKKKFLPGNIDPVSYELMKGIKRLFDPNNILNPHKIFL